MENKLREVYKDFTSAMLQRLNDKEKEGFTGWDAIGFTNYNIPKRLSKKAKTVYLNEYDADPKHLVDIANFAMMLYHKIKREEVE